MIRSVKIGLRLAVAFGAIVALIVALGVFSLGRLQLLSEELVLIDDQRIPALDVVGNMDHQFLIARLYTGHYISADSNAERERYKARIDSSRQLMNEAETRLGQLIRSDKGMDLLREIKSLEQTYWVVNEQMLDLSHTDAIQDVISFREQNVDSSAIAVSDAVEELRAYQAQLISDTADEANSLYSTTVAILVGYLAFAVGLASLIAVVITRSINKPLRFAVTVAKTIADNDLTTHVHVDGNDEVTDLIDALSRMQSALRENLTKIASSSDQLAASSEELSVVTHETNENLQNQNEELEQSATAVNELTSAIEEVANNAVQTAEESQKAQGQTQEGYAKVEHTVTAIENLNSDITQTAENMDSLSQHVKNVASVLDVIRNIAEQTNLLALNAAIEAARAGEAGRGFAVVADEVRALASRTQTSTREIEEIIASVEAGTDEAVNAMRKSNESATSTLTVGREAGEALNTIADLINLINDRNSASASASEEQAHVARDVDRSLVRIRDLALQNSTGAEQTSSSSQELARLAEELNGLVAQYKI